MKKQVATTQQEQNKLCLEPRIFTRGTLASMPNDNREWVIEGP